jgi:hypothetical protein
MQDVEILYRGKHVDRLTRSDIIFWNSGKQTLYGSDIVADDAVRCELSPDALALEVRIIKCTRDANKFTARIDDNSQNRVILSFDYLDPQDGAVIELLHTDSVRDPCVKGTIRGVPKGMSDRGRLTFESPIDRTTLRIPRTRKFARSAMIGILVAGVISIASALGASDRLLTSAENQGHTFSLRLVLLITGVIYILFGGFILFNFRRKYPKTLPYGDDV